MKGSEDVGVLPSLLGCACDLLFMKESEDVGVLLSLDCVICY